MPQEQLILIVACFFTATLSGMLGMAGGISLLTIMAQFYKQELLIPLHGIIQLVSNSTRLTFLFKDINWNVVSVYCMGALLGAAIGSQMNFVIDDKVCDHRDYA